ncbi:MAG: AAA family ATPase [Chthoniobacteraceae bacterium]
MISEIRIQNFKSIHDLALKPGRVTVLIGENGSGKSNILEAIAFAAGAAAGKLDSIFLANRGVRVVEDTWTTAAFPPGEDEDEEKGPKRIRLSVKGGSEEPVFECRVHAKRRKDDGSFDSWAVSAPVWKKEVDEAFQEQEFAEEIEKTLEGLKSKGGTRKDANSQLEQTLRRVLASARLSAQKRAKLEHNATVLGLADFMIYAPDNETLRTPPPESVVQPLGVRGQGLLKLLQSFSEPKFAERLPDMKERLQLFGWFEDFLTPDDAATVEARLQIRDKWLAQDRAVFDQRSANEGFLYLLFYFTVLMSWRTPRFFAFDNVDNALNPKLCSALMRQIAELTKKHKKQVICTTHNAAILDGLNLHDDEQRLYAVRRDSDGHTVVHRVRAPQPQSGETPVRLSEAFARGIIGGLPDHF